MDHLSPHQKMTYRKHGFFYVRAKNKHYYAISNKGRLYGLSEVGQPMRVHSMKPRSLVIRRKPTTRTVKIPDADRALGVLLYLEAVGTPIYCHENIMRSGNAVLNDRRHFRTFVEQLG